MRADVLFKDHDNTDCEKYLNIVRYLHAIENIDIRARNIVERNFPKSIKTLPTMILNNNLYTGLSDIASYYENELQISNLISEAQSFALKNPNYRITDTSSHKNIKL